MLEGVASSLSDIQINHVVEQYLKEMLDSMVERLTDGRAREIADSARTIENSEDLRFVLERIIDRPIGGEVERLRRLLRGVLEPVGLAAASQELPEIVLGFLIGGAIDASPNAPRRVLTIWRDEQEKAWRAYDGPLEGWMREKALRAEPAFG